MTDRQEQHGTNNHVDIIVVGTGLVQSLFAAACARVGKAVLHVDSLPIYGGSWGALSLEEISERYSNATNFSSQDNLNVSAEPYDIHLDFGIRDVSIWDTGDMIPRRRQILIDICPKLCFAEGKLVQLLVSSNTSRYLEFKEVSRLYQYGDTLTEVPCTKANLMTNKFLSPMSKRKLVKFLQYCLEVAKGTEETNVPEEANFIDYMRVTFGLTEELQNYVLTSMTWLDASASATEGVAAMGRFLRSVGIFCPSPFIFPSYGVGEVPQAFCRLCAVFGGVYILNTSPIRLLVDGNENGTQSVYGVKVGADYTFLSRCAIVPASWASQYAETSISLPQTQLLSRATFLLRGSSPIMQNGAAVALVNIPIGTCGLKHVCRALLQSSLSGVCPSGYVDWKHTLMLVFKQLFPDIEIITRPLDSQQHSKESQVPSEMDQTSLIHHEKSCPAMKCQSKVDENLTSTTVYGSQEQQITEGTAGDSSAGDSSSAKDQENDKQHPSPHTSTLSEAELACSDANLATKLVWYIMFRIQTSNHEELTSVSSSRIAGLWTCSDYVDGDIGFDAAVSSAERLFTTIYPGEPFLPRAPDYNEIIHDYPNEAEEKSHSQEELPEAAGGMDRKQENIYSPVKKECEEKAELGGEKESENETIHRNMP